MKKRLFSFLTFTFAIFAFTSCSDDEKLPGEELGEHVYTGEELVLTNDAVPAGPQVAAFTPAGNGKATITLSGAPLNLAEIMEKMAGTGTAAETTPVPVLTIPTASVIPGSASASFTVDLAGDPDNCTFAGSAESDYCTFGYSGSVSAGKMALDIKDIKLKDASMAAEYTVPEYNEDLPYNAFHINWQSSKGINVGFGDMPLNSVLKITMALPMITMVEDGDSITVTVAEAFTKALKDVTFGADGSITATYFDTKKDGRPETVAPKGLASYVVKDAGTILVFLNPAQIIAVTEAEVKLAKSKGRALDITALMETLFKDVLPMLSNGIPVKHGKAIISDDSGEDIEAPGQTAFYLGTETLLPLLKIAAPVLSDEDVIKSIVAAASKDPNMGYMAGMLPAILAAFPDIVDGTTVVELGINLKK